MSEFQVGEHVHWRSPRTRATVYGVVKWAGSGVVVADWGATPDSTVTFERTVSADEVRHATPASGRPHTEVAL